MELGQYVVPFSAVLGEVTSTAVEKLALDRHGESHVLKRPLLSRPLARVLDFEQNQLAKQSLVDSSLVSQLVLGERFVWVTQLALRRKDHQLHAIRVQFLRT